MSSGSPVLPVAKRGVVTIPVATVGDPGNPSVGVWQVFKTVGAAGSGVTLPPDVLLGCGYASLAVGLSIVGAQRQRELEHALRTGGHVPLTFRTVALFTVGGVAFAVLTIVLVIAQT